MKLSTPFVQPSLHFLQLSFVAPLVFICVRLPSFAFFPSALLSFTLSLSGPPPSSALSVLFELKLLYLSVNKPLVRLSDAWVFL